MSNTQHPAFCTYDDSLAEGLHVHFGDELSVAALDGELGVALAQEDRPGQPSRGRVLLTRNHRHVAVLSPHQAHMLALALGDAADYFEPAPEPLGPGQPLGGQHVIFDQLIDDWLRYPRRHPRRNPPGTASALQRASGQHGPRLAVKLRRLTSTPRK